MTIAHTENAISVPSTQLCIEHPGQILIEGPRWGDAEFYGAWLQLAARANELLWLAKEENDPAFERAIDIIEMDRLVDLEIMAIVFLAKFVDKQFYTFTLSSIEEDLVYFCLMAQMGFFVRTGNRYQMVLPTVLEIQTVKNAHLALAHTEDEDWIHPERLVVDMPFVEATQLQRRMRTMNQVQRLAERNALLRENNDAQTEVNKRCKVPTGEYRAGFARFVAAEHALPRHTRSSKPNELAEYELRDPANRQKLLDWCVKEFEPGREPTSMAEFIGLVWMWLGAFGDSSLLAAASALWADFEEAYAGRTKKMAVEATASTRSE